MIYRSRYRDYEIVVEPMRKMRDDTGTVVLVPGKKIKFRNGLYETTDKKEIEFLRNQKRLFGIDYWEIDPKEIEKKKKIMELSKQVVQKIQNGEINEKELHRFLNSNNNKGSGNNGNPEEDDETENPENA